MLVILELDGILPLLEAFKVVLDVYEALILVDGVSLKLFEVAPLWFFERTALLVLTFPVLLVTSAESDTVVEVVLLVTKVDVEDVLALKYVVVDEYDVDELPPPVELEDCIGFNSLICLIKYAFSSLNCSSSDLSVWKRDRKSTNFS